jgi:hypothetical protein
MEIIIIVILSLSLGLILGGGYGVFTKKNTLNITSFSQNESVENHKIDLNVLEKSTTYFDTLELRLIKILVETPTEEVSVKELNDILHLSKLSHENQRQRRHLFLKDLNVKLKMLYNVNDCIERKSSLEDKRIKTYHIKSNVPKEELKKIFMS